MISDKSLEVAVGILTAHLEAGDDGATSRELLGALAEPGAATARIKLTIPEDLPATRDELLALLQQAAQAGHDSAGAAASDALREHRDIIGLMAAMFRQLAIEAASPEQARAVLQRFSMISRSS